MAADAGSQRLPWYELHPVAGTVLATTATFLVAFVAPMTIGADAAHAAAGASSAAVACAVSQPLILRHRRNARARAHSDWVRQLG